MFTQENRDELESRGVTVVHNVIPETECDRHVDNFRQWLNTFPPDVWPQTRNSLIWRYRCGHLQPAWETRLATKPVFAKVWGTEKLLTSMDAIAIGRPPEDGQERFWSPDDSWLHVDQFAEQEGLHTYQGAVYLEHCNEDDWTFEVIENSHTFFEEFADNTRQRRCNNYKPEHIQFFEEKGCKRSRVPCSKGGMILWDSRLVHANAKPLQGRENPGRWRFVVFVSMAPAAWASEADLEKKIEAYNNLQLTNHSPSQNVKTFPEKITQNNASDPTIDMELPAVAKTDEAKKLVGLLPYDDDSDVKDEGVMFRPVWNMEKLLSWESC